MKFSKFTRMASALSEDDLNDLLGGSGGSGGSEDSANDNCGTSPCLDDCNADSIDVNSELASGGGTTDSYE